VAFLLAEWERDLNGSNATVRWTVACRWLDSGNTIIFAEGENANQIPPSSNGNKLPNGVAFLLA